MASTRGVRQVRLGVLRHAAGLVLLGSVLAFSFHARAGCEGQWDVGGTWVLALDNGGTEELEIVQAGGQLSGTVVSDRGADGMTGTVIGRAVSFTTYQGGEMAAKYFAVITDDGGIAGKSFDPNNLADRTSWSTEQLATCLTADLGPGTVPTDPNSPPDDTPDAPRMVTVISDVDLYDLPGGTGTIIGMLAEGESVPLLACREDQWCEIDRGWVWGEFLEH